MSMIWTPDMDPACELWIDPADPLAVSLDSAGRIEQIADKSGYDRHATQTSESLRPYPIGGAMLFHDSDLRQLAVPGLILIGGGYLFAAVGAMANGIVSSGTLLGLRETGDTLIWSEPGSCHAIARYSSNATVGVWYDSTLRQAPIPQYSRAMVMCSVLDPTSMEFFLNGVGTGPVAKTVALNSTAGGSIGASRPGGHHWDGPICDVIVTSDTSEPNRERVEGYLAHKWRLQAQLPVTHPYRSAPPGADGALRSGTVSLSTRRVVHFRPSSGECLSSVQPDPVTGAWSTTLPQVDDVYMAVTGDAPCQPIVDGPYDLTGG